MAVKHPVIAGFKPAAGTIRLVAFRWLLWILSALPGIVAAGSMLGDPGARRPFFADAPDPLPLAVLGEWMGSIPGGLWGLLVAGAVVGWLGSLMLTAAAVEILDPARGPQPIGVWRAVFDSGTRYLWAYLRVAFVALIFILVGARLINSLFDRLSDHGQLARWSGHSLVLTLGIWRAFVLVLWLNLVGVGAAWCRVLLVADGRRFVRRLPVVVLRLWWRYPVAGLLFPLLAAHVSIELGAVVLFGWRQSPGVGTGWSVVWLLVMLLQAWLWHWRLHTARLIWADTRQDDLRQTPDAPWSWLRRRLHGLPSSQGS